MDLLDGTPIVDIKPYVPFSDAITDAKGGIAQDAPILVPLTYTALATQQINLYSQQQQYQDLAALIEGVLSQDPRPAYKKAKDDPKLYQVALYDLDIFWCVTAQGIEVLELKPTKVTLLKD